MTTNKMQPEFESRITFLLDFLAKFCSLIKHLLPLICIVSSIVFEGFFDRSERVKFKTLVLADLVRNLRMHFCLVFGQHFDCSRLKVVN